MSDHRIVSFSMLFNMSSANFFQNHFFKKKNLSGVKQLGSRQNVGLDLGQNCLQRLSADDTCRQRVNRLLESSAEILANSVAKLLA